MRPTEYDLKIIKIVKNLRELNRLGQKNVAKELKIDQSTYCRIEKGESALTYGQLKIIAKFFKTHYLRIIVSAEEDEM